MCVLIFARVSGPVFVLGARMQIYDHLPDCIDALKMGPALWRGSEEADRYVLGTEIRHLFRRRCVRQHSKSEFRKGIRCVWPSACLSVTNKDSGICDGGRFSSWKRCCHGITWRGSTSLSGPSTHVSPQVPRVKLEWESSKTNLEYIQNVTDNKSEIPSRWILSVH